MSTTSSATSSFAAASSSSSFPISLPSNPQLSVKLSPTNYFLWRAQLQHLLRCYDLLGHIDGTLLAPPEQIADQPNPAFREWYGHDQLILMWINLSLTEAVMPHIVNKHNAKDAWDTLAAVYAAGSPVIVGQLRRDLHHLRRGTDSAHDYLLRAKTIFDKMVALGDPIKEVELVTSVIDGLDEDYRPFTRNLEARLEPVSFADLSSLMLSKELQLRRFRSAASGGASPQAFYGGRGRGAGRFNRQRGGRSSGRGFQQMGRGFIHPSFAGPRPMYGCPRPAAVGVLGAGPLGPSPLICHNCGGRGHTRPHCPSPLY
ncbi:unnamed protein product [Linum trigynum]|uniref:CCHC-type domain-containing protein n=1 Tax=Linum trigynum TaxID=586398 RepID=A0AAV2D7K1_9ROSI